MHWCYWFNGSIVNCVVATYYLKPTCVSLILLIFIFRVFSVKYPLSFSGYFTDSLYNLTKIYQLTTLNQRCRCSTSVKGWASCYLIPINYVYHSFLRTTNVNNKETRNKKTSRRDENQLGCLIMHRPAGRGWCLFA